MKFNPPLTVQDIATKYDCEIIGDPQQAVYGINVIHSVEHGDITFVDVRKYFEKALRSAATTIIINEAIEVPNGKSLLISSQPFEVYNDLIHTRRPPHYQNSKHITNKDIHPSVIIEPGVVVGEHVSIGAHSIIQANCYIGSYTAIGKRVIIEPNSIIGSDAFYYKKVDRQYAKWTSGGQTIIEDDVEVGAGSTVNKGVSSATVVGEGSKIDCQVHIGHGCHIGKHCLIAAQVGIGGKTVIGDRCTIYGQVGIGQNLHIGEDVILLGKSGVTKSLAGGKTYFGYPAAEVMEKNRELVSLRQLPEFLKKFKRNT